MGVKDWKPRGAINVIMITTVKPQRLSAELTDFMRDLDREGHAPDLVGKNGWRWWIIYDLLDIAKSRFGADSAVRDELFKIEDDIPGSDKFFGIPPEELFED